MAGLAHGGTEQAKPSAKRALAPATERSGAAMRRAFAGESHQAAYVPPQARAVLARFDQRSAHYETPLRPRTS